MPDRPLPRDTREAPAGPYFGTNYIVMGIVFVCVLMALALLGAGMINGKEHHAAQLSSTGHHAVGHSSTGYHAAKHPSTGNRRN